MTRSNYYDNDLHRFLSKEENKARIEALMKAKKKKKQEKPENQNNLFEKEVMPTD